MNSTTALAMRMSLVLVLLLPGAAQAQDAASRFQAEAAAAWQEYLSHAEKMVGSFDVRISYNGKPGRHFHYEVKQNHSCRMFEATTLFHSDWEKPDTGNKEGKRPSKDTVLAGSNPAYTFRIEKKAGASKWLLGDVKKKAKPEQLGNWIPRIAHGLEVLFTVDAVRLADLMALPYFKLVEVRSAGELVEVQFDAAHPMTKELQKIHIQKGLLVLDPKAYWCLSRASLTLMSLSNVTTAGAEWAPSTEEIEYTYHKEGGVPVPDRILSHSTFSAGKTEHVTDYQIRIADVPDHEFYLSSFNLPEPQGVRPPRRGIPLFLWLPVLAGLCFVAMMIVRRFARR